MDYNLAIQILRNERTCVIRDGCDRECCARCDLAMDRADVLAALEMAIDCVQACADCEGGKKRNDSRQSV